MIQFLKPNSLLTLFGSFIISGSTYKPASGKTSTLSVTVLSEGGLARGAFANA